MGLNIKAVAELTGVPLHSLRAWERRYGIPRPIRDTSNRYRLYDEQDIADILWIKRQVEAGVSPAQASAMLRAQPTIPMPETHPLAATQAALYNAFVQRDQVAAEGVLNQAWSSVAPEQVITDVLVPTLRQIGDAWQRNLLSVEQEHFASNLVRQRLHAMIHAQSALARTAPRLVAACAPEEQHDLGLLMLTLLAKRQGWNVTYLGQRTPLQELTKAGAGASYIVLSVATVTGLASLLPLWSEPLPPTPLLFGGELFHAIPSLREHMPGAFLGDDAVTAIQTLATTAPRVSEWQPEGLLLDAARALDAARWQIVAETVARMRGNAAQSKAHAYADAPHILNHSGMFLTDALASALAFDTPALIDAQGAWLWELMEPRHVPAAALFEFLDRYRAASSHYLSQDHAGAVNELVDALVASLEAQSAGKV